MKNLFLNIFTLFLFFGNLQVSAQEKLTALHIGDKLPDLSLNMVNYNSGKLNLSELKGKAILIDFWGTFCAPCVGSIPKLDSLQKQFKSNLVILPVTDEAKTTTITFLDKFYKVKHIREISAVEDSQLAQLFPHNSVPTYIWIDTEHIVRSISSGDEITAENLSKLIQGSSLRISQKNDVFIKQSILDRNLNDSTVTECHLLTKYEPGAPGLQDYSHKNYIALHNASILGLFKIAYGEGLGLLGGFDHIKVITSDSTRFTPRWVKNGINLNPSTQYIRSWAMDYEYNYLLKLPLGSSSNKWELFRKDLAFYFPYIDAKFEKINKDCYVLKRTLSPATFETTETDNPSTQRSEVNLNVHNSSMKLFFEQLKLEYQDATVLDETNYKGMVNINIEAEVTNPEKLNSELNKFGLQFIKEKRPVDILVLRDLRTGKSNDNQIN